MPTFGFDIGSAVTPAQWLCLAAANISWVVPSIDVHGAYNLDGAAKSGFSMVDGYMVLHRNESVESEVRRRLDGVKGHKFGRLWLDTENPEDYQKLTKKENCKVFHDWVDAVEAAGLSAGVASNYEWWSSIVDADCTLMDRKTYVPIWDFHYDMKPDPACASWHDKPYGGWKKPYAKSYAGHCTDWLWHCNIPRCNHPAGPDNSSSCDVDVLCDVQ